MFTQSKKFHRFLAIVAFAIIFLAPAYVFAKTVSAGVPKDQIWFSKDPFFVGDQVTIFTLVYNSSEYRLSGTMMLKDGTTTINKQSFSIEPGGASQVLSFPWLVTSGTHSFHAVISKDEFSEIGGAAASATLSTLETVTIKRFADFDKNHNGVGDSTEPPPPPPPKIAPPPTPAVATKTPVVNPVTNVESVITDVAPTPVSSIAVPVLGSVENFRLAQGNKAEKNLVNAEAKLAAHEGTTTSSLNSGAGGATSASWELVKRGVENGSVWKTPFDYFKLFLAIIAHFFTTNIYAFYSLVLLVIFLIVRTTLRFFF